MPPLSREEHKVVQARNAEKREILDIIERADEKISNLEDKIRAFVVENAETISRDPNLNVTDEGFNSLIDEVLSDIWQVLWRLANIMIASDSTIDQPSIWREDTRRPTICYGPEDSSALPIIESFKSHLADDMALRNLFSDLIQITGDHHRELRVMPPEVQVIINRSFAEPEPEDFSIGFIVDQNADVQLALVETGDVIFGKPNSIGPFLSEILSRIQDRVEVV